MKFHYRHILPNKFSHRQYSTDGDEITGIVYHDNLPPITQEEFDQADLEMQQVEYLQLRKENYPSDKEKINALWEFICNKNETPLNELKKIIGEVDEKYQPPMETEKLKENK